MGNLYATDYTGSSWRVFSPPGPNQATTVAVPIVQVYNSFLQPGLLNPAAPGGGYSLTLQGQSNVTYVIQFSPDLVNWTSLQTNYSIWPVRALNLPLTGAAGFFRAAIP